MWFAVKAAFGERLELGWRVSVDADGEGSTVGVACDDDAIHLEVLDSIGNRRNGTSIVNGYLTIEQIKRSVSALVRVTNAKSVLGDVAVGEDPAR